MTRGSLTKAGQLVARGLRSRITAAPASGSAILRSVPSVLRESHHPQDVKLNSHTSTLRPFSTTSSATAPLAPDVLSRVKPADITDGQYHELSDEYLDNLLNKFEAAQDERDNLDVEYSVGPLPSFFMISLPTGALTITSLTVRRHEHQHSRDRHLRNQQAATK